MHLLRAMLHLTASNFDHEMVAEGEGSTPPTAIGSLAPLGIHLP